MGFMDLSRFYFDFVFQWLFSFDFVFARRSEKHKCTHPEKQPEEKNEKLITTVPDPKDQLNKASQTV